MLPTSLNSHTIFQANKGDLLWKILCNPDGILAGEERNSHTRETSFFALELSTGRLLFSGATLTDKWWLSIAELTRDALYIQHYAEGPLPTPNAASAIDLKTGSLSWSQPRVAYFAEANDEVILLQQGMLQEQYLAVDKLSGEMTRRLTTSELPARNEDLDHLTFPALIDPDETPSGEVQRLLEKLTTLADLRGTIEYLDRSGLSILSFYSRDTKDAQAMLENKLVQEIAIFDRTTEALLFHEQINVSANYPVAGSYFLFNAPAGDTQLLYVKDGNTLKSIALA